MVAAATRRLGRLAEQLAPRGAAAAASPSQDELSIEELKKLPLDMPPPPKDVPGMAAQFMRDGFLHVPNALTPEQRDHCLKIMEWSVEHPSKFTNDGVPTDESISIHIKNTWNTENRDGEGEEFAQTVLNMMTHAPVCDVAEAVLGDDMHLHGTSCWTTRPGRPTQQLHVDYVPIDWGDDGADLLGSGTVEMPFMVLTAHYYLDDLYEELGPTKFIAGSHLSGRGPKPGEETWNGKPAQALLVKGGDCVLFVSTVWHFGSANTSQDTRHMMQFHYSNRWIHRHFQPYLDSLGDDSGFRYRPEILAKATPRQRRLLNEHPPTNSMNGSSYDQPLCSVLTADPAVRPPEALPTEFLHEAEAEAEEDMQAQAEVLLEEGWLVLRGCLSEERVEGIKRLMDDTAAAAAAASNGNENGQKEKEEGEYLLDALFNHSPDYLPLLDLQPVLGVVESALAGGNGGRGGDAPPSDCHMVQMVGAKGRQPGRRLDRGLYADYVPVVVPQELLQEGTVTPPPLKMISAHVALEDSCDLPGGGAVGIIPSTHLAGRAPAAGELGWDGVRAKAVGLKAGDVLLLRCDTWRIDTARQQQVEEDDEGAGLLQHTLRVDYAERCACKRSFLNAFSLECRREAAVAIS
jgi:hypothetical protein